METATKKSMHPLTAIAAISLTLFSLVGIGAITGLIPTSHSQSSTAKQAQAAQEPLASAAQAAAKPVVHKAAARRARPAAQAARSAEPVNTIKDDAPVRLAQYEPSPRYEPAPRVEPVKPLCHDCGVIESVREIEKKGEGSGLGAAVGGVAGGLLGRQTGGGRGRDVMTVLGAIGGAFAGNAVEKNVKTAKSYEIAIRFDDGTSRLLTQDNQPAWRPGERVRVVNSVITADNAY